MSYQGGGYGPPMHGGGMGGPPGPGGPTGGYPSGPPGYGGGAPTGGGPGKKGGGTGIRILIGVLALVMVAAVVIAIGVVVTAFRGDDAAAPEPSASAAQASQEPSPSPSETDDEGEKKINPEWALVSADNFKFDYEVPFTDWKTFGGGASVGFDEDGDGANDYELAGPAVYMDAPCEGWGSRGLVGAFGVTDTTDSAQGAQDVAGHFGEIGYGGEEHPPSLDLRSVEEHESNGLSGHLAIVDIDVDPAAAECAPEEAVIFTAAFENEHRENHVRTMSVMADVGIENALTEEDIMDVLATVRDSESWS